VSSTSRSRPTHPSTPAGPAVGPQASLPELFALWRNERQDPASFYDELAARAAVDLDRSFGPLAGQEILDIGCGPGYYTRALRARGAQILPMDYSEEELRLYGEPPEGWIVGDAMHLPLADASLDGVFASNMLEHTPEPQRVITEMERVLRPGGWAYLSWTNWFSPWGGHDMTPYHLLGPSLGLRLYRRRHQGRSPKNLVGHTLWPVHIGPTLRFIQSRPGLEMLSAEPRYYPRLRRIVKIPIIRELVTWNCVVRMRKRPS
jgi:SAM-dependent methyltransferase